jgi:hypothetical protein
MALSTSYTDSVVAAVTSAINAAGTTPVKVAQATGIPQPTLHRRLTGQSHFTVKELDLIADHLDIPVSQLSAPGRAA